MTYAIIKTGGKQYIVKKGDTLNIEKLLANANEEIELNEVLLSFDTETKQVAIGNPTVLNAKVKAMVVEQGRAKKVTVVKYKPKIRYKKKYGHRQPYTKVKIMEIVQD